MEMINDTRYSPNIFWNQIAGTKKRLFGSDYEHYKITRKGVELQFDIYLN